MLGKSFYQNNNKKRQQEQQQQQCNTRNALVALRDNSGIEVLPHAEMS